MGLINFVVESEQLESEVTGYAQTIAGNAPMTIRAARRTLRELQKTEHQQDPVEIQRLIDQCFDSQDYQEGRLAFREKRPPFFEDR